MKKGKVLLVTLFLSASMSFTAFAGEWKQESSKWWYQNDDGGYTTNGWQEIDGKQYYFDSDGYMLSNSVTPDGQLVESDGALINYDGSSYQSILDYYTKKMQVTTPKLISEYKSEAANNNGLNGLAEICVSKISVLANISVEGVGEMANLYLHSGSGKNSEYMEWANKLNNIYMEEADKVNDIYMNSAS